jgi:hypothetical protein
LEDVMQPGTLPASISFSLLFSLLAM